MNIKLEIELEYDPESKNVTVISCVPQSDVASPVSYLHTMTETQVKFGILTLGKKFGKVIPRGTEICLLLDGVSWGSVTTHKQVGGRIDGLTSLYKTHPDEFQEGAVLDVTYDVKSRTLNLCHTDNE